MRLGDLSKLSGIQIILLLKGISVRKRLDSPLRKRPDGTFEEISWETAIQEIADQLVHIRDTYGGDTVAYAGGGGQGNHFPGIYASATRSAVGTPYFYSALAQEKTGDFWVHGKLFGKQNSMYEEPIDEAQFVLLIGTSLLPSHGIKKARKVINALARAKVYLFIPYIQPGTYTTIE